jgi:hypothetical protein
MLDLKSQSIEAIHIIRDTVCDYFFITAEQFHCNGENKAVKRTPGRRAGITDNIVFARQLYAYLMTKVFFPKRVSIQSIGYYIYEGYHHKNILVGISKVEDRIFIKELPQKDVNRLIEIAQIKIDNWERNKNLLTPKL